MSTTILTPEEIFVKIQTKKTWLSPKLVANFKNLPLSQLSLPANLSVQAYVLMQLQITGAQKKIIWCLPSARELNQARELLNFWYEALAEETKDKKNFFVFPEEFLIWQASRANNQNYQLLFAKEHLSLALPNQKKIKKLELHLWQGQIIKPLNLINQLLAAGYQPGPLPEKTGWYQKKGSTMLISATAGQWRINWVFDQIERIEKINLDSGLLIEQNKKLTLQPHNLAPSLNCSLADYLTTEDLLATVPPDFLTNHKKRLDVKIGDSNKFFGSVPLFAKQWSEFERWIKKISQQSISLRILSYSPFIWLDHLPKEITNYEIREITALQASLLKGFIDLASNTVYLTDQELIGKTPFKKVTSLASYEKLKPGDYLVHIDHGIGRFGGLVEKTVEQITREYLQVEYADEDKLYVPIEHTDRLSRYLGSPQPALEKLSSNHWLKVQKKTKVETAALARELLTLYAKRQTSSVKPWRAAAEEAMIAADFPFQLTADQLKAWAEIEADLAGNLPMDRLICGDVGFGKTELALRAAVRAVFNGQQAAILAPTTILAQQHFDTFNARLARYGIKIGLISRAINKTKASIIKKQIAQGWLDIIIGTHSLLFGQMEFKSLGLLIIDEEQRFGVKQKENLRYLKPSIHVLSLSATPIPRTLNLAITGLRELSIIQSPPVGRQAIKMFFGQYQQIIIKKAINTELERNGQIFYLVPRITDLKKTEINLQKIEPNLKMGIIHGQLPPKQVAHTMKLFDEQKLSLLLATSIIENGLDMPNVNTLIVENAQKFGLADLYQLKGRVGRGKRQAYAYFLTPGRSSTSIDKRLDALAQTEELGSGLSLALRDLELRGAGAILGQQQHGQLNAVGLHLYGQMLAEAIEEQRLGQILPAIPEVRLNLPLSGRISPELVPDETKRIQLYQRLAAVREPADLLPTAQHLFGVLPTNKKIWGQLYNLLELLEVKLLAEKARVQEINCWANDNYGKFSLKFLEPLSPANSCRLINFDPGWHQVEGFWHNKHQLTNNSWLPWLKKCLKLIHT